MVALFGWHRVASALVVVVVMLGSAAQARAGDPIDLLRTAGASVAVSSTVDNPQIRPEHLVDGKPGTAWNSSTGDLVGAWIAVRLPASAQVTEIRMTAGFTVRDKRGDLFTMNPRIRKVRVWRGSTQLGEHVLDIESRELQSIPLRAAGGDFRIEIVEIVPGTKPSWREISVSELQIWGTPGDATSAAARPVVHVGALDLTPEQKCVRALFPQSWRGRTTASRQAPEIMRAEWVPLDRGFSVCRVDHQTSYVAHHAGLFDAPSQDVETTRVVTTIAAIEGTDPVVVRGKQTFEVLFDEPDFSRSPDAQQQSGHVTASRFPLTTTETGLLVQHELARGGNMLSSSTSQWTLYRVARAGLTPAIRFQSSNHETEGGTFDECALSPIERPTEAMPPLEVRCEKGETRWHSENAEENGRFGKPRVERYRWAGGRYVRK